MASLIEFPHAPLSPIMVSFMRCRESRNFLGSYEARPNVGDVVAFIPYLDLPHYALDEERAIAFIDHNGFRGWISKDDVSANFDMVTPKHISCSIYFTLFKKQGWDATPILWAAIDWNKHFQLRIDDEAYDLTPASFFSQCDLITDCQMCGHPMMNNGRGTPKEDKCEACDWSQAEEEKDAKKRSAIAIVEYDEEGSFSLGEDWA
jgi:hypothetical protein